MSSIVDVSIFLLAVALIGGGLFAKDPALAAVVVGGILLCLVVASRIRVGGKQ